MGNLKTKLMVNLPTAMKTLLTAFTFLENLVLRGVLLVLTLVDLLLSVA